MDGLNLLPWREQRREEQRRQFLAMLSGTVVVGIFIIIIVHTLIAQTIVKQNNTNNYLRSEINHLDKQIVEIKDLKKNKQEVIKRFELIYELQASRPLVVHIYDELTRVIPSGLFIKSVKREGDNLIIAGGAQSNIRVSELMRNIEASKWFSDPQLQEIKTKTGQTIYQRNFILKLKVVSEVAIKPKSAV